MGREAYIWDINWVSYLGAYLQVGLVYRGHINRILRYRYGIEFNHFMKIFGNSNGKKHGKIPHKKETETLVHNI